jgi:uncharacterized membrane protein HdeD (DUF308 family)
MEGSAMVSTPSRTPESSPVRWGWHWRLIIGTPLLVLGCLAMTIPFVAGKGSPFILGILMIASGLIETAYAFAVRDRHVGNAGFFGAAMSVLAGLILLAQPKLALGALSLLLGLSFLIDGVGMIVAATRSGGRPGVGLLSDGGLNVLLGLVIASQWPVSGLWTIGLYVGCRILGSGWSKILGRDDISNAPVADVAALHPDPHLRLQPHPELAKPREILSAADEARYPIDRYWRVTFAPEALASAFDFNRAPFFQSFVEVGVEGSANVVRLLLYGANGRLRWHDLQVNGQVIPEGQDDGALVEFRFLLGTADAKPRP